MARNKGNFGSTSGSSTTFSYSTSAAMWASASSVVMWASTSTLSSTLGGVWEPQCSVVDLSTATGARCACGKFHVDAASLQIKSLSMGEVRQVVSSGYKLVHGAKVLTIRWT